MRLYYYEADEVYSSDIDEYYVCEDAVRQILGLGDRSRSPDEVEMIFHTDDPDKRLVEVKDFDTHRHKNSKYTCLVKFPADSEGPFETEEWKEETVYSAFYHLASKFLDKNGSCFVEIYDV